MQETLGMFNELAVKISIQMEPNLDTTRVSKLSTGAFSIFKFFWVWFLGLEMVKYNISFLLCHVTYRIPPLYLIITIFAFLLQKSTNLALISSIVLMGKPLKFRSINTPIFAAYN